MQQLFRAQGMFGKQTEVKLMSLNKQRAINIRINDDEYKQIQKRANELNMKLSEYVRFVCLNAKVEVRADLDREEKK
jgi:uncharacterized protein YbaP (TraB family)